MTEDEYARVEGKTVLGFAIAFMRRRGPNSDGSIG